ncbi:MAG: ABC-F family ATP-binding cassette domain-containing protein [Bacteroidetes bacterium]|nr:ABC-F family ATP-binding cassette domain-containing protein [Bacteroidota bacterium]MDA1223608.1 ABC-F family ATP-binding cassette domain-containing protein [Bacteroidota bacterium]
MNYLSVEGLSKSWNEKVLFDQITFGLSRGEKVALIAGNGSGKSSLMNILAGYDKPDAGNFSIRKDINWEYLPQDPALNESISVLENLFVGTTPSILALKEYEAALIAYSDTPSDETEKRLDLATTEMTMSESWDYEARAKQVLGKLNIYESDMVKPVGVLSGGQKKRVALARVLIDVPDLLILDEPTNHLDLDMIEWLEEYLSDKNLTLLLVTHDRYFLDRVCNKILELDRGVLYSYQGNYGYFVEKKAMREEVESSEREKNRNTFRRELEWVRKMPKARTTKSKSRVDAFDDLAEKVKGPYVQQKVEFGVKMERLGSKILEIQHLEKAYGAQPILGDFTYTFKRGEKIGVVGPNGVGKSTLLNMIMGLEKADKGKITAGETLVFGYFSQQGIPVAEDKRVIDVVKDVAEYLPLADGTNLSASQFLLRFGFANETQYNSVSRLSGGERRRLFLMMVLIKNPNFLILDEPTNDLDILTLATLEAFLMDYSGCVLVVTHDRYFMDKLVDHVFVFEGEGKVRDFPGNYTEYRTWKEWDDAQADAKSSGNKSQAGKAAGSLQGANDAGKKSGTLHGASSAIDAGLTDGASGNAKSAEKRKLTFKEKYEYEQLGKDIEALEAKKKLLEIELGGLSTEFERISAVSAELQGANDDLDEKGLRWLELGEWI